MIFLLSFFLCFCATAFTAPIDSENSTESFGSVAYQRVNETEDVYDLRQQGNENYRVKLKDVTILAAPAEALIAASVIMNMNLQQLQKVQWLADKGQNASEPATPPAQETPSMGRQSQQMEKFKGFMNSLMRLHHNKR